MNGLSVLILVVAFCVLIVGLFAVIVERTGERDEARAELDRRADVSDELVSAVAMAESLALELSHADATIRNLAAKVAGMVVASERRSLRVVPPSRSDSWLEQVMDEQAAIGAEQSGDAS